MRGRVGFPRMASDHFFPPTAVKKIASAKASIRLCTKVVFGVTCIFSFF
jgi:hypothetical protein